MPSTRIKAWPAHAPPPRPPWPPWRGLGAAVPKTSDENDKVHSAAQSFHNGAPARVPFRPSPPHPRAKDRRGYSVCLSRLLRMMLPEARDSLDHHRKGPASRTRTRTTNRPCRRPVLAQDVDLEGDVGEEGVERQTCTARNSRAARTSLSRRQCLTSGPIAQWAHAPGTLCLSCGVGCSPVPSD